MTEKELKIKLSVDTTQFKSQMAGVKQTVNDALPNKKNSKDVKDAANATHDLGNQLQAIKKLNFVSLMHGLWPEVKKVGDSFKGLKSSLKDVGYYFSLLSKKKIVSENIMSADDPDIQKFSDRWKAVMIDVKEGGGLKASLGEVHQSLVAIGKSAPAILASIGAIVIAIGLLARNAIKCAQAMKQLIAESRRAGMLVAEYQKWGYVLEKIGIEHDRIIDFVKGLSAEQAQAIQGNKDTIATFEKLNISAKQLQTLNQQELFAAVIKGLGSITDETERMALAYKIFGEEDAANLLPLLQLTSKEVDILAKNYKYLGGYATDALLQRSQELTGATQDLRIAWQGVKNTLAEAVLPVIIPIVEWLVKATATIRMFFHTVLNTSDAVSGGFGNITDGVNGAGGAMSNAIKVAEKLKRTVAGFDELNILNFGSDASASGAGGLGGGDGSGGNGYQGLKIPTPKDLGLEDTAKWFEENKQAIEDWATGITSALGVIMAIVGFATGNIALGIAGIGIAGLGISFGLGEGGTWERLGQEISDMFDGLMVKFPEVSEALSGIWTSIKEAALSVWEAIKTVWDAAKPYVERALIIIGNSFRVSFDGIFTAVISFFKSVMAYGKILWNSIGTAIQVIAEWVKLAFNQIKLAIDNIKLIFTGLFQLITGDFDGLKETAGKLIANLQESFSNVGEFLKNIFTKVGNSIKNTFKIAWEWITGLFGNIGSFFSRTFTNLGKTFKKLGVNIGNAVSDGAKTAINWVLEKILGSVNKLFGMINSAIGLINKIPGVNISKIEMIQIPKLATGGIATGSTLANVGEAGREAILPLDRNTQWMDMLADRMASRTQTPSNITLVLDGKELGKATIKSINGITAQTGKLQLNLA